MSIPRSNTQEMPVRRSHYHQGPVQGLYVPAEKKLHLFDRITMAGQIKPVISIGRVRRCDIQVRDPAVSALHCEIERQRDGSCTIVDVGSKNGVYVNDVKVARAELRPGMWIFIGYTELIAFCDGQEVPVFGRNYTSFLVRARDIYGSAESAGDQIHRSPRSIYRAIEKRKENEPNP